MGIVKEFRDFAVKGNVVDMAVGIVIGGAFTAIAKSLVSDVIMPPIGLILGNVDFSNLRLTLRPADPEAGIEAVAISYGLFINTIISFVIVALALFLVVRTMNRLKREAEEKPKEAPAAPADVLLLTEIRDLLRDREG